MDNISRRDFVKKAAVGSATLASLPALANVLAGTASAAGATGWYFVALSFGPTVDSVVHTIAMSGAGSVSADGASGGGSFAHFNNAAALALPKPILATGTWRPRGLVSFNPIGSWGELVAGIIEMSVRLHPVGGGVVPATMKIVCNLGPAGISTGQAEGYTLTVGDLTFAPAASPVGLTVFTNRPPFA